MNMFQMKKKQNYSHRATQTTSHTKRFIRAVLPFTKLRIFFHQNFLQEKAKIPSKNFNAAA